MNGILKRISLLLLVSILCLSLAGCFPYYFEEIAPEHIDQESLQLVGEPTMSTKYDEEFSEYNVYIEGYVKNRTESSKSGTFISFVLYDADGNTLSTASAYCEYLEGEGTWRFCAMGYSSFEPASFKLVSLY